MKDTLANILVPYDFLAGRLKFMNPNNNNNTGRLEIDCNAAGVGFVVASSEHALDEIGDLAYPNPAFAKLVCTTMEPAADDHHDQLLFIHGSPVNYLLIEQVTTFKCGGFAMGISNSHVTFDGLSFRLFLDKLAALATNKPLAVVLYNDSRIIAAQSPPHVTFPHPDLLELKIIPAQQEHEHEVGGQNLNPRWCEAVQEELDFKILRATNILVPMLTFWCVFLLRKCKSSKPSSTTSY
ncbi:hypothetical protein CerSpe_042910 [Prunus speciosa]